jgi:hypothetical protein
MNKLKEVEKPKKQKKSKSYALKAVNTHLQTLIEADLIDVKDGKIVVDIMKKATGKFIKEEYGI